MVIAEYQLTATPKKTVSLHPEVIIPLSARNTERLNQKASDLLDFIRKHPSVDLHEMAYTLQVGREAMNDRVGFLVSDIRQLTDKLQAYVDGEKSVEAVFRGQVNRHKEGLQLISQDKEIQETLIDKWLSSNQLATLAGTWVEGLSFDWNRLYGMVKPRRIDLPLYPFAKERYWIEYEDLKTQALTPETSAVIHPLLHLNTSNLSQQCYSSNFSGEEFFLADHRVQLSDDGSRAQKVLPGVAYLEMARAAIENAMSLTLESDILELHNIIWVRPIIVTGKRQVGIALLAHDDRQIDFEIYSWDDGQKVEHCQGQAVLKNQPTPAQIDVERLTKEMYGGQLEADRTYAVLRKMGLYYGPAHQGINVIYQGEKQVLAQLRLPEVVEKNNGDSEFVLHPSVMDSALQAAVGFTEDLNQPSRQPSLPFALETLRIFSPCKKIMYSWVRYAPGNKPEGKLSKLDIDLMDQDGAVCVQLRGLTSRMVESEIKQHHQKMASHSNGNGVHGHGNDSSFNETFYEALIKNILNNEVSIDEAVNLE